MRAKDYYEPRRDFLHFSKLTNTGIDTDYDAVFKFAEDYLNEYLDSIANKEDMNDEIENQFNEWKDTANNTCKPSFTIGFKQCFYWLKNFKI